jgi:predicted nucleic acid-binding Zn ribbon protein
MFNVCSEFSKDISGFKQVRQVAITLIMFTIIITPILHCFSIPDKTRDKKLQIKIPKNKN